MSTSVTPAIGIGRIREFHVVKSLQGRVGDGGRGTGREIKRFARAIFSVMVAMCPHVIHAAVAWSAPLPFCSCEHVCVHIQMHAESTVIVWGNGALHAAAGERVIGMRGRLRVRSKNKKPLPALKYNVTRHLPV